MVNGLLVLAVFMVSGVIGSLCASYVCAWQRKKDKAGQKVVKMSEKKERKYDYYLGRQGEITEFIRLDEHNDETKIDVEKDSGSILSYFEPIWVKSDELVYIAPMAMAVEIHSLRLRVKNFERWRTEFILEGRGLSKLSARIKALEDLLIL